jgi:glycosyltransferase involved in cell wall biosynthesis
LPPERNITDDEEYAVKNSDAVICLGNAMLEDEYRKYNNNVFSIDNGVFPLPENQRSKSKQKKSKDIIFLAGRGNIHKGLDLLIDVFSSQKELTLHVCQHIDADFLKVVGSKIESSENIIMHDYVEMRSQKFNAIAESCSYAILPTCSEGQPGSILECMLHGLVPIIPEEANIDFDSFAIPIETLDFQGIEMALLRARNLSEEDYESRSTKAIECCEEKYSEQAFRIKFRESIISFLSY